MSPFAEPAPEATPERAAEPAAAPDHVEAEAGAGAGAGETVALPESRTALPPALTPTALTAAPTGPTPAQVPAPRAPEPESEPDSDSQPESVGTPDLPDPTPLPRRVPQRQAAGEESPRAGATEPEQSHTGGDDGDTEDGGARPLRRRVRGATLASTLTDAGRAARRPPRQTDAEEVRSELDEFEAAVERANRDVASGTAPGTTNSQAGLPEGADQ